MEDVINKRDIRNGGVLQIVRYSDFRTDLEVKQYTQHTRTVCAAASASYVYVGYL